GLMRALVTNLRAGRTVQGGSTITQQVVKNILLDSERSYSRKVRETILARRLEQYLHKDEILGLYLNQIYLGHGRYGVEEAARYYFGKKAVAIDLAEAALLAGLVAAPERFSPRRNPVRALERRRFVLRQMLSKGFITRELYAASHNLPLRLAPTADVESQLCPEVVALAKRRLHELAGDAATSGGYTVHTTIRPDYQAAARGALRGALAQYAERHKLSPPYTLAHRQLWGDTFVGRPKRDRIYVGRVVDIHDDENTLDVQVGDTVGRVFLVHDDRYNPKHVPAKESARIGAALRVNVVGDPDGEQHPELRLELGPQGALVAIDPRTREVLALVGSAEALAGGLDRATRAHRQPGSAFKPFVYSYALHSRRLTAASLIDTGPDSSPDGLNDEATQQRLSLRMALAKSVNAAAQRVLEQVGAATIVAWANALGIESRLEPTPSLALGAYEVSPLEIANAYATFASSGVFAPPTVIARIEGPSAQGLVLPPRPPNRRVMSPEVAYLTTSLM
ncbi:MAG: transglycosylase domain-containing protein, partial [Anaerolineae bacterium]